MTPPAWNPSKLDVAAFVAAGATLAAESPARDFPRWVLDAATDPAAWPAVAWQVQGERRPVRGGVPELWLHLQAHARAELTCQRCLQAVALPVEVTRAFRFVASEAEAVALDAEADDDVLALSRQFNLPELVEDELLLALPIVALHTNCSMLLPTSAAALTDEATPAAPHPFAALQALRKTGE